MLRVHTHVHPLRHASIKQHTVLHTVTIPACSKLHAVPFFFFYVCFCTSRKFDWDNSLPLCHVIFGTCLNNHPYTHTPTARARLHTHTHTPRLVNQRYWNSFCCSSKMSEVFKTCGSVLQVWIFTVLICQKLFSFMGADVKILVGQKDSSKNPEEEQQQKPVMYSVFCFLYIHIFSDVHDNKKSLLISLFFSFCSPPPSSVIQKKTKKAQYCWLRGAKLSWQTHHPLLSDCWEAWDRETCWTVSVGFTAELMILLECGPGQVERNIQGKREGKGPVASSLIPRIARFPSTTSAGERLTTGLDPVSCLVWPVCLFS